MTMQLPTPMRGGSGRLLATAVVLALVFITACEPQPQTDGPDMDTTAVDTAMTMETTIVDAAAEEGRLSTLSAAIASAELAETLSGPGPFTVFAPTDSAFEALDEGTLDELLQPDNQDQLRNVLLYHVANGRIMASDLSTMDSIETAQGSMLPVTVAEDSTVSVGDASVVTTDVEADNGVVHVIDGVLMPPSQ